MPEFELSPMAKVMADAISEPSLENSGFFEKLLCVLFLLYIVYKYANENFLMLYDDDDEFFFLKNKNINEKKRRLSSSLAVLGAFERLPVRYVGKRMQRLLKMGYPLPIRVQVLEFCIKQVFIFSLCLSLSAKKKNQIVKILPPTAKEDFSSSWLFEKIFAALLEN